MRFRKDRIKQFIPSFFKASLGVIASVYVLKRMGGASNWFMLCFALVGIAGN